MLYALPRAIRGLNIGNDAGSRRTVDCYSKFEKRLKSALTEKSALIDRREVARERYQIKYSKVQERYDKCSWTTTRKF